MRFISALMLVLSVVFLGCGKDKPEPSTVETSPEARNLPAAATPADTAAFVPAQPVQQPEIVNIEPAIEVQTEAEVVEGKGGFTLQVSSWWTQRGAEKDADRFITAGYEAYVYETSLKENEPWFRVRIGRYQSYDDADKAGKAFNEILQSGYWVDTYRN